MLHKRRLGLYGAGLVVMLLSAVLAAGCGGQAPTGGAKAVEVKAMQVMLRDAPREYVYAGQVQAKDEVELQSRVSGNLVAKMVNGGDTVRKGQPLFQIDRRQYESALFAAKAQLSQAEANLSNARLDLTRYEKLSKIDGIPEQTVATQRSLESQYRAAVEYNRANVKTAEDDLHDTLLVSPVDGRININDLAVGSYVQAGSTTLASVSSVDPVFVQFNMSENEYLNLVQKGKEADVADDIGRNVHLMLSNGSEYPLVGKVEQVNSALGQDTGTLTLKALFANPDKILIPGMFTKVKLVGKMRHNVMLIPQKAVQQLLNKTFVTVVGEGDKAETRQVQLGDKIGALWVVESGLAPADRVVVEGMVKVHDGMQLSVVMMTPEELNGPAKK